MRLNRTVAAFITLVGISASYELSSSESDRIAGDFSRADRNSDGRLTSDEWRRGNFQRLDSSGNGFLELSEVRAMYEGHLERRTYDWPPIGYDVITVRSSITTPDGIVDQDALDRTTKCAIGRGRKCRPDSAIRRGLIETGLRPQFPADTACPGIDDIFALDYTFKRNRESYHGGIDIPVPWGTPIIAAASGTVVGIFAGENSPRGIEIVIRHSPADTGLPVWVYTAYSHLDVMPPIQVGQQLKIGQLIGPTGNSGISGKKRNRQSNRRPALHFAAVYAETKQYAVFRDIVVPINARWLDPLSLYRHSMPIDSTSMKALPDDDKVVAVSIVDQNGIASEEKSTFVWPYRCSHG